MNVSDNNTCYGAPSRFKNLQDEKQEEKFNDWSDQIFVSAPECRDFVLALVRRRRRRPH